MRIGIDIKCLRTNNSGIGRYTRNLMNALQKVDSSNEYVLFSPSPVDYQITNPKWSAVVVPTKLPGILWQQLVLPKALKREKIDVVWGPEQTIPVCGLGCGLGHCSNHAKISSVLTIHDFVYKRFPETMQKSVLWITRIFGSKSIKSASAIVPVSEFTEGELFHFYPNLNKDKVDVVSCAVNSAESCLDCRAAGIADRTAAGIADRTAAGIAQSRKKQLLFVGSLEPRKNLPNLIYALEILQKKGVVVPLVLTGPKGWKNKTFKDLIATTNVAESICHKGYVSDEELRALYKESAAVVFPSVYEGFGLPALEALSFGTPVLTSKGTVMASALGDCGLYFDAADPQSMAQVIEKFWNAGYEVPESSRRTLLARYTWENSASKLIEVFQKVCHE